MDTTSLSSLIHSHKLDYQLYADDIQVYISLSTADTDLSLKQLGDCLHEISGWMTNNRLRLNANKTDFIIISTSRQRSKLTRFFPMPILSHSIMTSDTVYNLGVTFDSDFNFRTDVSLTCRCCFYHLRDLPGIRCYISLSVAKTIATTLITSWLDYCNSLLYNIASKDILKLYCILNCLGRIVTQSLRFSHSVPLLKSLHWLPVQSLYYCLSNSFFWTAFISIFHAFFSTEAPFIWFSR